ncbi:Hypothetical protein MCYN_0634 [Mycoplasmopsis cynos C142]|uniref:Uncharacterized protein n=1 Tax=Mycoplasmopsis cynos (strain C142) TaxID=1246955 RepID=L0RXQ1_MYCC1|nr:Hypothetical protein MCYN_0634 [Mycoplasmopsis cynos C142]
MRTIINVNPSSIKQIIIIHYDFPFSVVFSCEVDDVVELNLNFSGTLSSAKPSGNNSVLTFLDS